MFVSSFHIICVQEFVFDLDIDVIDGSLSISAIFELDAKDVSPARLLSDISASLSGLLVNSGTQFQSIASTFDSSFSSATQLLTSIAENDNISLSLSANLNAHVRLELSFDAIEFSTTINELDMAFLAKISDTFDVTIAGFGDLHITPSVQLRLQAENTATPFDLVETPSALGQFQLSGDFDGLLNVAIDDVPAEISLSAYSSDITNLDSLEFEVTLDIDLVPIEDSEFVFPNNQ